ncbi:glycoside hydrolase family 16 protein [Croceicoccus naphthovorans]|uniref:Glucan endo-1,3-beta-D-glucosidase n=1 Tax=Croceicoccus naphthovorans TaxID=1348774 RepID=A0A0G3XFR3_9SPHN|nr:glycoside hydrolase family 16 protein [Croceicoccus naphthovorans]AKM10375.1 glucan endo-1,3-beta-D-glucosidase [Croceicoccus naphthovorans]MBB3990069.1 beta-glucanase (GH16 family) [Croceicoccus naphthovorans]
MRQAIAALAFGWSLSACATVPPAEPEWELVWSDEFDMADIDRTKWDFDIDCWGGANDERQCYTDHARNARIEDGVLVIEAHEEETTGPAIPIHRRKPGVKVPVDTKPYTSARMVTRGKAAWQYGKIEVRAQLPQGQGTWPAIWMMPEHDAYGLWALSGEIDVMEAVNLGVPCEGCPGGKENTILGTLHFGGEPPENALKGDEVPYPPVLSGYHVFGLEWSAERMVWTVDGKPFAIRTASEWYSDAAPGNRLAPFDQPFHLILNLAVGGRLPEGRGLGGFDPGDYPKRMKVDWVRIWQCAADPATGSACER